MKKIVKYCIAAIAFFLLLQAWGYYRDARMPAFTAPAEVLVTDTTTVDGVISQIKATSHIKFEKSLRKVFERKRVKEFITPGYYKIEPSYSAVYVARMLNNAWQSPVKVTLSGSLRLKSEVASRIGKKILLDSATIHNALNDKKFLEKYGFTPQTVFALIIPDTYEVYWDATLDDLFTVFRKEYDKYWTDERKARAAGLGLTPLEVSIVASIVRCESNYTPEYRDLAGVYLNRLRKGMKLQACPTVAFCYDFKLTRILNRHLQVKSPYNTYTHAGLPPGPICCPTRAALNAVLDANTASGYLFFCASTSTPGQHLFAKTYREHSKNAKTYHNALN